MTSNESFEMTPDRAETYRLAAAELLAESIARGDQHDATITFAVGFLLRRADSVRTVGAFITEGGIKIRDTATCDRSPCCKHLGHEGRCSL